ncbi:hypothetical protein [Arthrobacter sp. HMWF013]|nr:hypothetical protein [Arthrobacter sp. HMWF013]
MPWIGHLKIYNDSRGQVNTALTRDAMKADFRVLDHDDAGIPLQH